MEESGVLKLAEGLRVVDADSHMTERHDLFTERAPKGYEDRVPHVERIDGEDDVGHRRQDLRQGRLRRHHRPRRQQASVLGLPGRRLGNRRRPPRRLGPRERLRLMDEVGIDTQVLYPNSIGLGGQNLCEQRSTTAPCSGCASSSTTTRWPRCRRSRATACCPCRSCRRGTSRPASARRSAAPTLGYRGVNMTADPQDSGSPDLGDPAWDPFWEVCAGLDLPVHFHIGASQTSLAYLRHHVLAEPGRLRQAGHRRRVAVPEQLAAAAQQRLLGHVRPPPQPEDGLGRERDRLGARSCSKRWTTSWRRTPRSTSHKLQKLPVGVFPRQLVRHVLVRDRSRRSAAPGRLRSARTTSCSRPTSRTRPACIRTRSRWWARRWPRCVPRRQRKIMGGNAAKLYRLSPAGA